MPAVITANITVSDEKHHLPDHFKKTKFLKFHFIIPSKLNELKTPRGLVSWKIV